MLNLKSHRSVTIIAAIILLAAGCERAPENEGDGVSMDFVRIPAGEYMMSSPVEESDRGNNEEPQHQVKITEPFYISITEVTQQQYTQMMGHNPSIFKGADNPVERMSWGNAMEFCRRLSEKTGRKITLPTEAQWEYACRAGTDTNFSFDEDDQLLESYCWYKVNSNQQTHPVALKKPNNWGIYDMHGNVQEWCIDQFYDPYYSRSLSIDPEGPSILRIVRGGSFAHSGDLCRSASRRGSSSDNRSGVIGFRVVFRGKIGNGKNVMRITLAKEADKLTIAPEQDLKSHSRHWRMISGTVRDEAGIPVDSTGMEILPTRHWNINRYDGMRFEAELHPKGSVIPINKYHFVARHTKRNLAAIVEINKDTDTLDAILQPGVILTGKVVDSAGKGIEKAVVVIKLKGSNWQDVHPECSARTDTEGKFIIRALPLGLGYILTARARGYGPTNNKIHSGVVRGSSIVASPIVLTKGKYSVSGLVVDKKSNPVVNATVRCFCEKDRVAIYTQTDTNGKFTAYGIFEGPVKINASNQGDSPAELLYGQIRSRSGATDVMVVLKYKTIYGKN